MRANEVCKIFKIARSTIDGWVEQGILTKEKIGNVVYFYNSEVQELAKVN